MNLTALHIPRLDAYFGEWAIVPDVLMRGLDAVRNINLAAHVAAAPITEPITTTKLRAELSQNTEDGIATIRLCGPLMKFVGSATPGTSTVATRVMVRAAKDDPNIKAVLLHIDSPGGTVAGTPDLADDIAALAKVKPVYAYIEDIGASAALWLASQATRVIAGRTAKVGSIGVYAVLMDYTGKAAMEGIKVHVVSTGGMKGAGEPGTPITQAHLGEAQRIINEINDQFLADLAKGRRLSAARLAELNDGRVWHAPEAMAKGLVDAIGSIDDAVAALRAVVLATAKEKRPMSNSANASGGGAVAQAETAGGATAVPVIQMVGSAAATVQDIQKALPKANAEFIVNCLTKAMTMDEVQGAWAGELERQLAAEREARAKAEKEAEEAKALKVGAAPLGAQPEPARSGAATGGRPDPIARNAKAFNATRMSLYEKADQVAKEQKCSFEEALAIVRQSEG